MNPAPHSSGSGMSIRILVVENDPLHRRLLARALETEGYEVTAVRLEEAARELARTGEFGLVVSGCRNLSPGVVEVLDPRCLRGLGAHRLELGPVPEHEDEGFCCGTRKLHIPFRMAELQRVVRVLLAC